MAYTLKHEHPEFPTGEDAPEFGVVGLGRIKNGKSLEIDDETERGFVASRGMTVEDAFKNNPNFDLSGSTTITDKSELEQLLPPVQVEEEVQTPPQQAWNTGNDDTGGDEDA